MRRLTSFILFLLAMTTLSAQTLTPRQKHLAILAAPESNEWLEPVNDTQYNEAHK